MAHRPAETALHDVVVACPKCKGDLVVDVHIQGTMRRDDRRPMKVTCMHLIDHECSRRR